MKRFIVVLIGLTLFWGSTASAAVYVHGYFRKNGTYVQPYYRSSPDGNPYNNYSFPGNVNPFTGKVAPGNPSTYLYNYYNRTSAGTYVPSYSAPTPIPQAFIPSNASPSYYGGWTCNSGYKVQYDNNFNKIGCEQVIIPPNASLNYFGNDWICNSGYKAIYDSSFNKVGCEQVIVPPNAGLSYFGNDWVCDKGYKTQYDNNFNKVGCQQIIVPWNASLDYFGSDWVCNSGYKTQYDMNFNKVGCVAQ